MAMDFILDCFKLADVQSNLSKTATRLSEYNDSIYEKIVGLGSSWQGDSYDAFLKDANDFKPSLEDLVTLFTEYASVVDSMDIKGAELISTVSKNLNCDDITVTLNDNVYKSENIDGYTGGNLGYSVDSENVTDAKAALKQAEDVQNKLYYDLEVIGVEIQNERDVLAALEANKDKMDASTYNDIHNRLTEKIKYLETQQESYANAYNTVVGLTANNSMDIVDFFTNHEGDGILRGAADGWFGWHDSVDDAKTGLEMVNDAIKNLVPVSVFVEGASVNGLLAYEEGYHADSFRNGVNVSNYAMEASFNIAENSEGGTSEIAPGVVAFNSKTFVDEGKSLNNNIYGSTSHTFSQTDAYTNYDGAETSAGGFDSVRITNSDGEYEYMTYSQYVKLGLDKNEVDAVTGASASVSSEE